jgi:AraC-like DNA-binding protein
MANVEWLLREAMDERTFAVGERTVIDDANWRASIERIQLGPGLHVFLTDAEAHEDITVEPRDPDTDQNMCSQVTIAGRAEIDFLDGERSHVSGDRAILFRPSRRAATFALKAGTRFQSAGYRLDVGRVVRLFEGHVPEALRGLVEEGEIGTSRVVAHRSGRAMRHVAGSLFGRGLNGPLRIMMMEGAALQLLAMQANAAGNARPARRARALAAHERDSVHEAYRRLLANMCAPPTLGALAAGVGLSEKRLNAGFRQLFGATVYEVLRNERLAHAKIALQSDHVLLKEVAFRVGYNHVTNFINAFTHRYGAPPREHLEHSLETTIRLPDNRASARRLLAHKDPTDNRPLCG